MSKIFHTCVFCIRSFSVTFQVMYNVIVKGLLRTFVFVYISLYITQLYLRSFEFGGDSQKTFLYVVAGLCFLLIVGSPLLKLIGLPYKGMSSIIITFILVLITFFVMPSVVPDFNVAPATMQELIILGFVLPSKDLTATWSLVFSALSFSVIYKIFLWLC